MRRFIFVCMLLVSMMALTGCAAGPFANQYRTEQLVQGPDGRVTRVITTQTQDMSGSVGANFAGLGANVLANGANAAIATNFGNNYSSAGRILEGLTYPGTNWNTNWGTDYVHGGYYGGGSYTPMW